MPCNKTWETAAGDTMPMHAMSDQHVINAYHRIEQIIEDGQADMGLGGGEWEPGLMGSSLTEDFEFSLVDLEVEAERRWGSGDGEALIRERLEKGVHGVPLKPFKVGRKS